MGEKRLETLSPEQQAAMAPFAEAWVERALDCSDVDWDRVRDGMRRCYEFAGLSWHGRVVVVQNPLVGAPAFGVASHLLRGGSVVDEALKTVGGPVNSAVDGAVRDAVNREVGDAVNRAVRAAVRGEVDAVDGAVRSAVYVAVRDAVSGAVRSAVYGAVDEAVHGAVSVAVHNAVYDAVHGAVSGVVGEAWKHVLPGQWSWSWEAWAGFFLECCGVVPDMRPRYDAYRDAQLAGWWWPHSQFVIVCDRPRHVHRQQIAPTGWGSHRLHSRAEPAIVWRDGFGMSWIEGVHVPNRIVTEPWTITVDECDREPNAERRRVMIRQYGPDVRSIRDEDYDGTRQYLVDSGAQSIDFDGGTRARGSAPRALVQDKRGERWLIGTDGSTRRVYVMSVPPEAQTCAEAHRMINGGLDESLCVAEC